MMMVEATKIELAEYLVTSVEQLPTESGRLLKRASELVFNIVRRNIIVNDAEHISAMKSAICAQVESWLEVGESSALGGINSFSIGDISMQLQDAGGVCPRAKMFLNSQGLLYRGIGPKREVQQV